MRTHILESLLVMGCVFGALSGNLRAVENTEAAAIQLVQNHINLAGDRLEDAVRQAVGKKEGDPKADLRWGSYKSSESEYVVSCDLADKFSPDAPDSDFYVHSKWQWWANIKKNEVRSKTEAAGAILDRVESIKAGKVYARRSNGELARDVSLGDANRKVALRHSIAIIYGHRAASKEVESGAWYELLLGADGYFAEIKSKLFFTGYGVYGYSSLDNKVATLSKGYIASNYTSLMVRGETPAEKRFGGYADISGGYYRFDHGLDGDLVSELRTNFNLTLKEEVENSLGWAIGGGVRYRISNSVKVTAGVSKHFVKTKVRSTLTNITTRATATAIADLDMGWSGCNIGFNFIF